MWLLGTSPSCALGLGTVGRGTAERAAPRVGPFLFLHVGRPGRCRVVCKASDKGHLVESKPAHLVTMGEQAGKCVWRDTDLTAS